MPGVALALGANPAVKDVIVRTSAPALVIAAQEGARDISGAALGGVVSVPDGPGVREAVLRLRGVVQVEPAAAFTAQRVPNDPAYPDQWGHPAIQAPAAWDVTTGSPGIRVAVLDTGVDLEHPDLASKIDVFPGTNLVGTGPPDDDHGHGTHVAGIVAAETDNSVAVSGTSWAGRIVPVKVLDENGNGDAADVVGGINAALASGARVIVMSLAGCDDSPALRQAVSNAVDQGVVFVAASGNVGGFHANGAPCGASEPRYPASYPGVVGVASVNRSLVRSQFSLPGPWVAIAAPGGEAPPADPSVHGILSAWRQGDPQRCASQPVCTSYESGTSQAAPFVAGAVALLLSAEPSLSPSDVIARLRATARDLGPSGPDTSYGAGLLDAAALVGAVPSDQILAEGATSAGFDEYVLLANPGTEPAWAQVDFLTGGGIAAGPQVQVLAGQRVTLHANDYLSSFDVSVRVRTFGPPVLAERAMYIASGARQGATAGRAVSETATTWYLPEGSTGQGFEEYVLVANPSGEPRTATVTWHTPAGPRQGPSVSVGPFSRVTIRANDSIPLEDSLSAQVTASGLLVVERAVYVTEGPLAPAATDAPGVVLPGTSWIFAEGSTYPGFEEYVLVQNPGTDTATVSVAFLRPQGPAASVPLAVPPGGRHTLRVGDVLPGESELGAVVTSDRPVLAERAMYYGRDGAAVSGIPSTARRWVLPEGSTGPGFDEWVLLSNPNGTDATVSTTLLTPAGSRAGPLIRAPANGRATLHLNDVISDYSVSVLLEVVTGPPVAVERTIFIATLDKSGATGSEGTVLG